MKADLFEPERDGNEHGNGSDVARRVEAYHDEMAQEIFEATRDSALWRVARQVAFDNFMRFLPSQAVKRRAFVAGQGAWWFARQLAEEGWSVTLGEISAKLIELYREELSTFEQGKRVQLVKLDICEMPRVESGAFSAVLLMGGALSECGRAAQAMAEGARIATAGALVTVSARNKYAAYTPGASRRHLAELSALLNEGVRGWVKGYRPKLFSAEELIGMLKYNKVDVVRAVSYPHFFCPSVEEQSATVEDSVLSDYLELERRYAGVPSLLGRGPILDVIGRKVGTCEG